ncbi:MAG: sensor histidine kinase [Phycisphaerales bacterium]
MNPKKNRLWWAFWIGVLIVLAALGWATRTVHSLEQQSEQQRLLNDRQELIRLALWRMDSRLTPIIALEASRPVQDYRDILDPQSELSTQTQWLLDQSIQDRSVSNSYGQGYFEIDEAGKVRSLPSSAEEFVNSTNLLDPPHGGTEAEKDTSLRGSKKTERSFASEISEQAETDGASSSKITLNEDDFLARQEVASLAQKNTTSTKRSAQERVIGRTQDVLSVEQALAPTESARLDSRSLQKDTVAGDSTSFADEASNQVAAQPLNTQPQSESIGVIEPRWVLSSNGTPELVLVRVIEYQTGAVTQGVWLNWEQIQVDLLDSITDIVPGSTLAPILDTLGSSQSQRDQDFFQLATIPVAFEPGQPRAMTASVWTPAMIAILVTWIAVVAAMVAVGLVLRTVLNLSARRGRFVGAVTHELRTPLTTFRLYSQMLADGMVTDETVRKEYLTTLKRESDRLTGIVENVLEYARISRQRSNKDKPKGEQKLSAGELMARVVPPMSRLGEQSGMDLVVSDTIGDHAQRTVTLDPHAIERIMMNLMDNACKYAGADANADQAHDEDADLRVHLDASVRNDSLLFVVADHGPGVPAKDRRKIFGEFVRGSSGTMRDRSGLGLGLALSKGLALEMGGDLSLVRRRGHGAEFELRIPLDAPASIEQ